MIITTIPEGFLNIANNLYYDNNNSQNTVLSTHITLDLNPQTETPTRSLIYVAWLLLSIGPPRPSHWACSARCILNRSWELATTVMHTVTVPVSYMKLHVTSMTGLNTVVTKSHDPPPSTDSGSGLKTPISTVRQGLWSMLLIEFKHSRNPKALYW